MSEYVLRPATPEDSTALFELTRAALGPYIVAVYGPWEDAKQLEFHRRWFDPGRLSIIESDGQPIGVLDDTFQADRLDVNRIAISPGHQRRGIGTSILIDLLAEADRRRIPAMLQVYDINPARHLYERLGFVETNRIDHKVHMTRFAP